MEPNKAKVLILGGGGREYAIAKRLADEGVKEVFCLPGNGGTAQFCTNIQDIETIEDIISFVKENNIDLTIVGSEYWLEQGIADDFFLNDLLIIGPSPEAAQIETSKSFTRNLLREINTVHQPLFRTCVYLECAELAKKEHGLPLVLKANGLANGKGVFVCKTEEEWEEAIQALCRDKVFGKEASQTILVEEYLEGPEISVFVICDTNSHKIIGTAQDYKRIYDKNEGPNTGGMGAYAPSVYATTDLIDHIDKTIISPVLGRMRYDESPFTGFLYAGLMIVKGKPYVIEFNARLGDPETQVILPLITSSFFDLVYKAAQNRLEEAEISFSNQSAVTIVKAAQGYPADFTKNTRIKNLDSPSDCEIIHAGTSFKKGLFWLNNPRVLNITGTASTLSEAVELVCNGASQTQHFDGEHFRKDIGQDALQYLHQKNIIKKDDKSLVIVEA